MSRKLLTTESQATEEEKQEPEWRTHRAPQKTAVCWCHVLYSSATNYQQRCGFTRMQVAASCLRHGKTYVLWNDEWTAGGGEGRRGRDESEPPACYSSKEFSWHCHRAVTLVVFPHFNTFEGYIMCIIPFNLFLKRYARTPACAWTPQRCEKYLLTFGRICDVTKGTDNPWVSDTTAIKSSFCPLTLAITCFSWTLC